MSYENPKISPDQTAKAGLDIVIDKLKKELSEIPYLKGRVFGRAIHNKVMGNEVGSKTDSTPQVYIGNGEHYNAMPNDNLDASVFFFTDGEELIDFGKSNGSAIMEHNQRLNVVFWGNLAKIRAPFSGDSIYTENIKKDFLDRLCLVPDVSSINSYLDSPITAVFAPFTLPINKQNAKYPFVFFRLNITVTYKTSRRRCLV